ncbi:MAG TPA: hypothetical protein VGR16_08295 [Thermomicrobiales bacterium]|nr:hypothetical protein [Thermomicrobiales bacterium]
MTERDAGVDEALTARNVLLRVLAVTLLIGTSLFLLLLIESI